MALTWPQYNPINVILHFLLLSWQHYSVKISIILEISKQRYGINGHNIFLIWAKYGPNILSIVIHYLYSICHAWLFSEILSLQGIRKHKYCKNSQNMVLIWFKYGPYMVPIIWHWLVFLYLACMTLQWKFEPYQASRSEDIVEIAKTWS